MKNYKKSQFLYNFILYSLTTLISCSLVYYSFWFPSINSLFSVSIPNIISFFFTAKFLFFLGNVIVVILIGESKQTSAGSNSSPATEIYNEYVARSRRSNYKPHSSYTLVNKKKEEKMENLNTEDKTFHAEKKTVVKICSGIPTEDLKGIVESNLAGSSSCSSPATGCRNYKAPANSSYTLANKKVEEDKILHAEKKKEVKICSRIVKREKREKEEENYIPTEELNRRVEAYISRVNKQRLLEAKSLVCSTA
ncbi:DUF4408 domain-containing protein [Abeliophyllum distichum]|uniref:DUF4408 domain-containing protein n=1 Tax=Abeliophyllum distichum TaxID=126358 RepID=A0ABD1W1E6_9LAMI